MLPVLLLALLLSACAAGQRTAPTDRYAFTDDEGQAVTVDHQPQRVAVLFSSFADIWVTAGGRVDITVGEAVERGFAPADAVLVDESAGKAINVEALIAAQPTFVIGSADIPAQVEAAALLRAADIPTALFRVESFEDYLAVLKRCTDITQNPAAYETYGLAVKDSIRALLDELPVPSEGQGKRILFIRSGSGASSAKAKTADQHFAAAMLKELGAYNIADNAPVLLDGLSIEEILREDPDYIFISTMGDEAAAKAYMESVLQSDVWQALGAVQKGNYTYLPKDLFQFKPNAAWEKAYRYLAELLYPEMAAVQ